MADSVKCFGCGTRVPATSRFCGNCGRLVVDPNTNTVVDEAPGDTLLDRLRRVLAGDFEVDQELARGGMGIVYRALDEQAKRPVALKILSPELGVTPRAAERFKREGRMVAELEHPNIVPVYRVGQIGGILFIAMKFVEGRSLDEILDAQGPLPVPAIVLVLQAATRALLFAHERGIVHRDVKAANILLDRDGNVMVSDFGVALRASDVTLTADGSVIGTPGYMSPEQCAGQRATPQGDHYSLGMVAFQMLTGRLPFQSETLAGIMHHHFFTPLPDVSVARDDVPFDLARIIARLSAKKPVDRYATTRDLLTELESLPLAIAERRQGEQLLRRLARGDAVDAVTTRSLPALPDTPTLQFAAAPQRPRFWNQRAWVGVAAALVVLGLAAWVLFRPAASAGHDSVGVAVAAQDSTRAQPPAALPAPAPARARPPVTGLLRLLTSPSDAEILVDGRARGTGAVLDLALAVGSRRLQIRARGYITFDTTITISADSTVSLGRIALRVPEQQQ
jgi:predicted Ser/Thr protein kinase